MLPPIELIVWADIASSLNSPGLVLQNTLGFVLSSTFVSEDHECVLMACNFNEYGWTDYTTIPTSVIAQRYPICVNFLSGSELSLPPPR